MFNNIWRLNKKTEYSEEMKEILSKSSVTVFSPGDRVNVFYLGTFFYNLYSLFRIKYDNNFYGYLVYTQIRMVNDNAMYILFI
ncbi:hypothetical protein CMU10_00725 [Elizabethkingia anophelis]|nr:hypothetical protein [Elizabethkingia anophelis]MDV3796705.1 hypothetical protein [Elizabethkingia anophelis]OCW72186.1 hypothetical protein A4G24_10625 [Elizabethkingia anophelis]OPC45248.1 hypothetical protein BAY05_11470 [Elizabethkingia anophelis]CAH1141328.1 hypothetical protein EAVVTKC53_00676 [Elizabethkingia anophelis]